MGNIQSPEFNLRVREDRMAVLLDCTVRDDNLESLLTRIESQLKSMGIAGVPTREQLEEGLRQAAQNNPHLVNLVIVEGKRPVPPQDGAIEWAEDFFSSGFAVDEKTGAVDYRRRVAQTSVKEGQLLARVIPAKEGRAGRDVFGKRIPVRRAKRIRVRAGPNVRVERKEDASYFYATKNGRIRQTWGTITVDEVYLVPGDVGLETGHIKHPGVVVIAKDVLAGSEVEADGDIEVKGTIEPADIRSGGNLSVRGGITGASDKAIKVAGSVHAKYILGANVEANEDIIVESEITQSIIKTRGALVMPKGRLVGGEVTALAGIVVGQAGSEGRTPTVLIAAEDYRLADEIDAMEARIASLEKKLRGIRAVVEPLMNREKTLTPEQRNTATEMLAKAAEIENAISELRSEMVETVAKSSERAVPRIMINERIYPETTLRIKESVLQVTEPLLGPLQAVLQDGKVVLQAVE